MSIAATADRPMLKHVGTVAVLAAVFAGALVLTLALRPWGFVHHDTSEVVMWAQSGWVAGFWKHPPFLPWLTRLWSGVMPMGPLSLSLLTALNMTMCAAAVQQIAALGDPERRGATRGLTLLLLACLPYATFMAIKLNHNTILISLWPLTTLAFLRALDKPTALRGILFGIAAAAAVLAKYYSLLLLAGCVAASVASMPRAWRFYRSAAPYMTIVAFVVALAPHLLWLMENQGSSAKFPFVVGANALASEARGPLAALKFAVLAPAVVLPLLILFGLLWRHARVEGEPTRVHRFEREVLVLTLVPYVLTALFIAAFNMHGPVVWAIPVFLCLPALAAVRLGRLRSRVLGRLIAGCGIVIAIITVIGPFGVRTAISRGVDGISDPRQDIAITATGLWRAATGMPLRLVGGDSRLTSAATLFSPDRPQGWPAFDHHLAPWVSATTATRDGFVGLCRSNDAACLAQAERLGAGQTIIRCPLKRQVSYLGAVGPVFKADVIMVLPVSARAVPCPVE